MTAPSAATLALIDQLVAFDTTSHKSNLALIDFVVAYLAEHGVAAELIRDPNQEKANLYATLGPADRPGVVLSGHTDVVPVDGQSWTGDPFAVRTEGDRLYGRGTADMKSFIAAALAHVPNFLRAGLKIPIHLAFSFDEEIGCVGVHSLLEELARRPVRPAACIVGEPTGMQVITAHKGKIAMRCTVTGKGGHSSQSHKTANAVEAAAGIIAHLSEVGARLRAEGPQLAAMDPPFATVHVGTIAGGVALNVVPELCVFEFEIRFLPGQDVDALVDAARRFTEAEIIAPLRAKAPEANVTWEQTSLIAALDGNPDSPAAQLAKSLTGANDTGQVAYGTEAGLFQQTEIPSVVCGPGHIDQAHKPDEFIDLDQIALCETFMTRLAARLAAGGLD